jgi:Icc protein
VLVAQITDCHIVEPGRLFADRIDTAARLDSAVHHIVTMDPRPDVVVATGDLVNNGRAAEYAHLAGLLDALPMPLFPIPGNHDDRTGLRSWFGSVVPGSGDEPVDYAIDDYPVRLVGLDTTVPGEHHGHLAPEQLEWLDAELGARPDRPTIVFQHHPPFKTGIEWMDESALLNRREEAEIVGRHPQVVMVTSGHIHRVIHSRIGLTAASCWPSTGAQLALALNGERYFYADEPPAVVVHRWENDEGLTSHLSYVDAAPRWQPPWAAERE